MLATALVFALAFSLFCGSPHRARAAGVAAVLFAVHPIHVEAVCSVSGRTDLLAAVFVLGAVLAALRFRDSASRRWTSRCWGALSILCFFCGLLAKENAAPALAAVPLAWAIFPTAGGEEKPPLASPRNGLFLILLLASLGGYAALRGHAGFGWGGESILPPGEAFLQVVSALGFYVRKVVFPWPQRFLVSGIPSLDASLAVLSATGAAAGFFFRRTSPGQRRVAAFSLLWIVIFITPALAVVVRPFAAASVAERYLYLPSAGFCLLAAQWCAGADFSRRRNAVVGLTIGVLALVYAATTVERSGVWTDNLTFWEDAARDPDAAANPLVLANLAIASKDAKRFDAARAYARQAYEALDREDFRVKQVATLLEIETEEGEELFARGRLAEALAKGDAAAEIASRIKTAPSLGGAYRGLTMGNALFLKARVRQALTGRPDHALLKNALTYYDVALRGLPQDRKLAEARAECLRLLESR
jgi:tetratricopeptide (TPR) repeat protein